MSSQVQESHILKRCHDLLEGKEDFGTVEDVYERLTEEFLQYNEIPEQPTAEQASVKVEVKTEAGIDPLDDDAETEVAFGPQSVCAVKGEIKEEANHPESTGEGSSLNPLEGIFGKQVKKEILAGDEVGGGSMSAGNRFCLN